jgi:hypothetical protein
MVLVFQLRWKQVKAQSNLWLIGFANIADIFRSRVYERIDKGGMLILRLSHLLTQVAHGITSIVQRFAALNSFNYITLEAA